MDEQQTTRIWVVDQGYYRGYEVFATFDKDHRNEAAWFAELVGGEVREKRLTLNPSKPLAHQSFYESEMTPQGTYGRGWRLGMCMHPRDGDRPSRVYDELKAQIRAPQNQ